MRTDKEIIDHTSSTAVISRDFFYFERIDLLKRVPFEIAKPHLMLTEKDEARWIVYPRERPAILDQIQTYVPFAWKYSVIEQHVLKSQRSMSHFHAWTWLIGDEFGDLMKSNDCGKENLRKICHHYGWDLDQLVKDPPM